VTTPPLNGPSVATAEGDRPRLLDLFCCEGGAGKGYAEAGFEVFGVDLFRHKDERGRLVGPTQSRYPFPSHQGDALEFLAEHGGEFDAIHASPPCQAYSITKHSHGNTHPELVDVTRALLVASGRPWVMENVPGAPMPGALVLCGSEFFLRAYDTDGRLLALRRHRLFESSPAARTTIERLPSTRRVLMSRGGCAHSMRSLLTLLSLLDERRTTMHPAK